MTSRAWVLGLAGVACQPTVSIGTNAGSSTGMPSSSSSTGPIVGTSAAATTDVASTSSSSGTPGEGSSTGPQGSSDGGEIPYACLHVPFESACVACAKQQCCSGFDQCAADFGCGCVLGCLQYPPPMGCPCPPNDTAQELFACLSSGCDAECPP